MSAFIKQQKEVIMEMHEWFKTLPESSIEEAIKQAKENMKLSNKILLLARRELKRRRKENVCAI